MGILPDRDKGELVVDYDTLSSLMSDETKKVDCSSDFFEMIDYLQSNPIETFGFSRIYVERELMNLVGETGIFNSPEYTADILSERLKIKSNSNKLIDQFSEAPESPEVRLGNKVKNYQFTEIPTIYGFKVPTFFSNELIEQVNNLIPAEGCSDDYLTGIKERVADDYLEDVRRKIVYTELKQMFKALI